MSEFGNHPHRPAMCSSNHCRELVTGFEYRELAPNSADLVLTEPHTIIGNRDVFHMVSSTHDGMIALLIQIIDEPFELSDVALAPLMGDEKEYRTLFEKPIEAIFPILLVDAVRFVNVHQLGEAAGHFVVLRSEHTTFSDVKIVATKREGVH